MKVQQVEVMAINGQPSVALSPSPYAEELRVCNVNLAFLFVIVVL